VAALVWLLCFSAALGEPESAPRRIPLEVRAQ
jgi:hypothetical protein